MAEQSSWSREGARLLSQEHKIRFVLTVLLAVFVVLARHSLTDPRSAQMAVGLMFAAMLVSRFGVREGRLASAQQFHISAVALALLDLVAVTLLLKGTGGAGSGFFSLYLISLIFAAVFFRGLELGLLTIIASFFYIAVSWTTVANVTEAWHMTARLVGLIVVAWYSYALSEVLRREKEARDQLLRHLTEGVIVFDAAGRVTLVNQTLLTLLGGRDEFDFMGRTGEQLAQDDNLLAWVVCDVGVAVSPEDFSTRVGCFPEANLPLVECTTIPCGTEGKLNGYVVVCKDLRDQTADSRSVRRSAFEKLAPLTNLRALSQALYGMAEYLEERERWQAVESIQKHTRALQGILADMLHNTYEAAEEGPLDLSFIEVPSLLAGTRRLLEIAPTGATIPVEIVCQEGLPEISADRGALGQSLLQMCKALVSFAREDDRLVIDVRAQSEKMVFTLQLVSSRVHPETETLPAAGQQPAPCGLDDMEAFEVITQHEGSWECVPEAGTVRRMTFDLPIEGPRKTTEESPERAATRRELAEVAAESLKLDPVLAVEVSNQLKNALNVIRGYAELAITGASEERRERALRLAIDLSDQASELVDSLQPTAGHFPVSTERPAEVAEVCDLPEAERPKVAAAGGVILVVDDDAFMRQLLVDMLEDAGYRTASASDGCEALEYLQTSRPDMVFVDLSMPRVTGVDVLRETKRFAPDLPIVLMTGYAYNLAMQALGEEKPYAVIGKPFAIAEVMALAKAVVGVPAK